MVKAAHELYEREEVLDRHLARVSRKPFVLLADLVFVTYARSGLQDKEVFLRGLQKSLRFQLSRTERTKDVKVSIFGSRELHEDGCPHYHVMVGFSKKVYWYSARDKFAVRTRGEDGSVVVDTTSINIRVKKKEDTDAHFVNCVQRYIAKHGDVFGTELDVLTLAGGDELASKAVL